MASIGVALGLWKELPQHPGMTQVFFCRQNSTYVGESHRTLYDLVVILVNYRNQYTFVVQRNHLHEVTAYYYTNRQKIETLTLLIYRNLVAALCS